MSRVVEVTVWQLELRRRPTADSGRPAAPDGVRLRRVSDSDRAALVGEMYRSVGAAWQWCDRVHWTVAEWQDFVDEHQAEVWVVEAGEELIGFFALGIAAENGVDLLYFGLVPEWIGRGIGGWLLDRALDRAWSHGPDRIRLETCSLDAAAALPNYLKRGFEIFREEQVRRELLDGPR